MATSMSQVVNSSGFHGPVTATLDWCEANYQFSYYIAEMANSFSNLFSISLALYGIRNVFKGKLPGRYSFGFLGFAMVGIGSFAFHATLLFHYQLADELPMIYVSSLSLWFLSDFTPEYSMTSARTIISLLLIAMFDTLFTWSYVLNRNPIYHQVVFGALVLGSASRVTYLLNWSELRAKIGEERKSQISSIYGKGVGLFVIGFIIWNLDNVFCDLLTSWKTAIGWPTAFLLEGHSWWHVFTGAGTYFMFIGTQYISLCMKGDPRSFLIRSQSGLPVVGRVEKMQ